MYESFKWMAVCFGGFSFIFSIFFLVDAQSWWCFFCELPLHTFGRVNKMIYTFSSFSAVLFSGVPGKDDAFRCSPRRYLFVLCHGNLLPLLDETNFISNHGSALVSGGKQDSTYLDPWRLLGGYNCVTESFQNKMPRRDKEWWLSEWINWVVLKKNKSLFAEGATTAIDFKTVWIGKWNGSENRLLSMLWCLLHRSMFLDCFLEGFNDMIPDVHINFPGWHFPSLSKRAFDVIFSKLKASYRNGNKRQ